MSAGNAIRLNRRSRRRLAISEIRRAITFTPVNPAPSGGWVKVWAMMRVVNSGVRQ